MSVKCSNCLHTGWPSVPVHIIKKTDSCSVWCRRLYQLLNSVFSHGAGARRHAQQINVHNKTRLYIKSLRSKCWMLKGSAQPWVFYVTMFYIEVKQQIRRLTEDENQWDASTQQIETNWDLWICVIQIKFDLMFFSSLYLESWSFGSVTFHVYLQVFLIFVDVVQL